MANCVRSLCACRRGASNATILLLLIVLAPGAALAQADQDGTSSREAKDQALREIPWRYLAAPDARVARYVTRKASLFRRSPTHVFDCDPRVFNFLAQHPEVVVNVWNLMGVSNLSLEKTTDLNYRAADQAGTQGALRIAYEHYEPDCNNKVVVLANGSYQAGPMPDPIRAQCVLILRSASRRETNGRTYVTARLDSFVRFEKVGADIVAKTLKPLLMKSADHNFTETMKFVSTFSRTAEQRPEGLVSLSQKLDRVDEQTRVELVDLCRKTGAVPTASVGGDGPIRLVRLDSAAGE